jgi:hypothetical protein
MPQDDFSQYKRKQSADDFSQFKRPASGAVPGEEGYEAAGNPYGNPPDPNTVVGGALRRARDVAKSIYQTVAGSPTPEEQQHGALTDRAGAALQRPALVAQRVGKGLVEGEKQAFGQVREQAKAAGTIHGDPIQKGLAYTRAGVTAASMADPLATGSVTNVNKLEDQGRNPEAIGQGVFDALTLLAGKKAGSAPSEAKTLSRAAYATDVENVANLQKIMPELRETIAQVGKPNTVQDLAGAIQKTSERLDQTFNTALARVANDRIIPDDVASALEAKANALPRTASGEAQALRAEAVHYRQQWTIGELNSERMYRNGLARGFEHKGGVAQMAAMRSSGQTMVDKIAADTARDVLYDYMERKVPGVDWRQLKQKQAAILDMSDHLVDHVRKLEAGSAQKAGAPLRSKLGVSAIVTPTRGAHPFLHFPLTGTPLSWANTAARTAFGPTPAALARSRAILAMPLTEFVTRASEPNIPKTPGEARDRISQFAPAPSQ